MSVIQSGLSLAVLLMITYPVVCYANNSSIDIGESPNNVLLEENGRRGHIRVSPLAYPALFGFGGLNALAFLFAIKLKIIFVVIVVAVGIFFYFKAFKRPCDDMYSIRDGGITLDHPPTGYSNHIPDFLSDHSSDLSGYSGPDPYSAYSGLSSFDHHSPHHSHHDFDHGSSHDFDHGSSHDFDHGSSHDFDKGPPSSSKPSDAGPPPDMGSMSVAAMSGSKERGYSNQNIPLVDIGEIAFTFLGVDTAGCRRRFVCELDFRANRNPITKIAFSIIPRTFFDQYRNLSEDSEKPVKFTDCARMFNDCKAAAQYDKHNLPNNDTHNDEDDTDNEDDKDDEVNSSDAIIDESEQQSVTEETPNDIDHTGRLFSPKPLGHLILQNN